MWLFVGLGNPGPKYAFTRHNIGFLCLQTFAEKNKTSISKQEHKAITGRLKIGDQEVLMALPQTFMNLSGESVQPLMNFYKIPHENLLVIHDEVDLPPMKIKFQKDRGTGGHNGIKSVSESLGSQNYMRLRLGVGRSPFAGVETADFVLQNFNKEDVPRLEKLFERTTEALKSIVTNGFNKTSTEYNRNEPEI